MGGIMESIIWGIIGVMCAFFEMPIIIAFVFKKFGTIFTRFTGYTLV
jgi:hypothetical protein